MVTSTEQIRSVQYLAASQVERPVINFLIGEARTDSCRPMPKKANDVEPSPFMLVDVADFGLRADVANFVAKWRASCSALRSTGLSPQHIVDILNRSQLRAGVAVIGARIPDAGIPLFAVKFKLQPNGDLKIVVDVTTVAVNGAFGKPPVKKPVAKKPAPKPEAKKPEAKPAPKPEAKKPEAKPAPKPVAKKPAPKKPAPKPAPKKPVQEAEPKPDAPKPDAK